MYAIVEVGAKQYNVKRDDIIRVDKLKNDGLASDSQSHKPQGNGLASDSQSHKQRVEKGKDIILDKVLLISKDKKVEIGRPYIKGAKVEAIVLRQVLGEKTTAYKYRRRKNSHWEKGHRAQLTELKIKSIDLGL